MGFFFTFFYQPIANVFFLSFDLFNTNLVWVAVLVLVLVVRVVLMPISTSAIRTQHSLQKIQPELKQLQAKYKDSREELARKLMALYKDNNVNPLSPILGLLIQIPIFITIFFVIRDFAGKTLDFEATLYSFVSAPTTFQETILSLDLTSSHSIVLAFLVCITQFFALRAAQTSVPRDGGMADQIRKQISVIIPLIIGITTFFFINALGLYWLINNIFAYLQEIIVLRKIRKGLS